MAIVISLLFVGQGTLTHRGEELIHHKHTQRRRGAHNKTLYFYVNIHRYVCIA